MTGGPEPQRHGCARYRARAELRAGLRSAGALALLLALVGGAVLGTAAGARSTQETYPNLVAVVGAAELLVSPEVADGADEVYRMLEEREGVLRVARIAGLPAFPLDGSPSARLGPDLGFGAGVVAGVDTVFGRDLHRPKLISGRLPDPDAAGEVLLSARFAARSGLHVGDRIDLVMAQEGLDAPELTLRADQGVPVAVEVVGVGAFTEEVVPFTSFDAAGMVLGTPALARLAPRQVWNFEGAYVDLAPGTPIQPLISEVESRGFLGDDQAAATAEVRRGLLPLAAALWLLAGLLGAVAAVVLGQAFARASRADADTRELFATLGMTRRQIVAVAVLRTSAVAVVGATGAVAVAFGVSAIFPVGPVRLVEPAGRLGFDAGLLLPGAVLLVLGAVASVLPGAWRGPGMAREPRALGLSRRGWRLGLPAATVEGVRWALTRRGSRGVPLATTMAAMAVAGASAVGAATFGASLDGLLDDPGRYGQAWDRTIDGGFTPVGSPVLARVRDLPGVTGVALGRYGNLTVNGRSVPAVSMRSVKGDVGVGLLRGRRADEAGEIVLGAQTARDLRMRLGDRVDVTDTDGRRSAAEVVGIGVFPRLGLGSFSTTGLGEGAQVAVGLPESVDAEFAERLPNDISIDGGLYQFLAVDVAGDPGSLDGDLQAAVDAYPVGRTYSLLDELPPTRVLDLRRVRDVPFVAAGLLTLVGLAALAHLVVVVGRERAGELRVHRALGLRRRQLRRVVRAHAVAVAVVPVALGVPLGIAAGRSAWRLLATDLDVAVVAVTPLGAVAMMCAATPLAALLVASPPAWRAARAADHGFREDT